MSRFYSYKNIFNKYIFIMSEVSLFCPAIFLFFVLIARKLVTLINSIYEDTADPGTTPKDHDPRHPAPGGGRETGS